MVYFADFVEEQNLTYARICSVLDCITNMSEKMKIEPYHASILLDTRYVGIDITYRTYMEQGLIHIFLQGGGYREYTSLEEGEEVNEYEVDEDLRKKVEKYVSMLTVSVTGAREGEVIKGIRPNMSKDAVIRIASGIAPPSKIDLDEIRRFPDIWKRFLDRLSCLDFYSDKSLVQRAIWLNDHERSGEYDIVDYPIIDVDETYMQILDVGKSLMTTIDVDILNTLLTGDETREDRAWKGVDIRDKFPKKPGSNARRPTLMFFAHYWKLTTSYKESIDFNGPVYNAHVKKFVDAKPGEKVYIFEGLASSYEKKKKKSKEKGRAYEPVEKQEIGIIGILHSTSKNGALPKYFEILRTLGEKQIDIDNIVGACKNFTASMYKSLLQKLIRYAPENVRINDKKSVASQTMLRVVFTLLLLHPGAFLPDIKRFVPGQESALKRLMISIVEDSYHPVSENLLHLTMLAFLAQRVVGWKIDEKDYLFALEMCDKGLIDRRTYDHGIDKGHAMVPYIVEVRGAEGTFMNISAVLDDIRSFDTDEAMVRYIASTRGKLVKADTSIKRPHVMDISHCIDQHCAPEIALLLPMRVVERFRDISFGSKPFKGLFKSIFGQITGINSRRKTTGLSGRIPVIDKEFKEAIINAQKLVLIAKQCMQSAWDPINITSSRRVIWKIDKSWIAGLVGPINVSGKPQAMVTMRPDDPYQLVAIRKPARGISGKDAILDDARIEEAIHEAKQHLAIKGCTLNAAVPPIPWLSRYVVKLDMSGVESKIGDFSRPEEKYVFFDPTKPRDLYEWKDMELVEDDIDVYSADVDEITWEYSLVYGGTEGIIDDAQNRLTKEISNYSITGIRRALSYISANHGVIEIERISKSGGATKQAVILEDVEAYQILLMVATLYPKALRRNEGYVSKFSVTYAPLLDEVKEVLRKFVTGDFGEEKEEEEISWGDIKDISGRIPRTYQIDTVNEMVEKRGMGKKGHFVWIPGGMGKTMIVLEYLRNVLTYKDRPKYILYSLPSSAIASVFTEIEYFGFWINYMRPIKGWKKEPYTTFIPDKPGLPGYTVSHDTLLEGYINVIEHDDLRKAYDELVTKANDTIFVIDEVHKALNDSKRTEVALSISRLSIDFVAMTGTPIVDTNTYKLIWWLEQIVDFEVNSKNFWVAANGMIAKKVNTGILVNRKDVVAEMSTEELKEYNALVPKAMGGTNGRVTDKDIRKAFEVSYRPCDREIVRLAKVFMKTGVMIVTRSSAHQETLRGMLVKSGVKNNLIHVLKAGESIFMTDESVEAGDTPDYKIVIVTIRQAEGYTLTRLRTFITSVYPSNNATREQLELRINRISQHAKEINYRTVHSGILTYVLQKHKDAASISAVLSALAKEI